MLGRGLGVGLQPLGDRDRLGADPLGLRGRLQLQLLRRGRGIASYPVGLGGGLRREPLGRRLGLGADPVGLVLGLGPELFGGALGVVEQPLRGGRRLGPHLPCGRLGLGLQPLALGADPVRLVAGEIVLVLRLFPQRVGDPLGPLEDSTRLPHAKGTGVGDRFLGQWQTRCVHATR